MDISLTHANCCVCERLVLKKNYSTKLNTPKFGFLNELLCSTLTDLDIYSDNRVCNTCLRILKSLDNAIKAVDTNNKIISELKQAHEHVEKTSNQSTAGYGDNLPVTQQVQVTPKKKKRPLVKTPTPKKLVKRALIKTPTKCRPIAARPLMHTVTHDKSTQTYKERNFTYKIVSNRNDKRLTRIIVDETQQKLCQALIHGDNIVGRIARILNEDKHFREALEETLCSNIQQQCQYISSAAGNSSLLERNPKDIIDINLVDILKQLKESGPLYRVLEAAAVPRRKDDFDGEHDSILAFAGSVLLYHRNPKLNKLQYGLGLILDGGGATDELIYQLLYKESSSPGTLYQLRNAVNRRDVTGSKEDVIKNFRPHHKYVDDVLNAYIIAAALVHFGMDTVQSSPTKNMPPEDIGLYCKNDQYKWLCAQAKHIRNHLTSHQSTSEASVAVNDEVSAENHCDELLRDHLSADGKYHCQHCKSTFKTVGGFVRHSKTKHNIQFSAKESRKISTKAKCTADPSVPVFINMAFLLRDTWDAYKFCDGNRAFRNLKFEFLYLFGNGHIKYRLWLWRMSTYEMATLTPREAFEYKWNIAVNVTGGVGSNMPNDNFVETQVKAIKQSIARQGPNKTFDSAQVVCKTTQIVSKIKERFMHVSDSHKSGRNRPTVNKTIDVLEMVNEICRAGLNVDPCKSLDGFEKFRDPLVVLDSSAIHQWITAQKKIAAKYMTKKK